MNNKTISRMVLAIAIVALIIIAIIYRDEFSIESIKEIVANSGAFAPIIFMSIYVLATVLFLPGSLLTLTGGLLFGPYLGTFYNLTGATIGAALAFLIARFVASDWVEEKTAGGLKRLKSGVESEGWRFVAFVRLVPLFPFNLLNYALGLTKIGFGQYILATYIFMLPGAIAYTYLGYLGSEAIIGAEDLAQKIMIGISLLAIALFIPRIVKRVKRKQL